eukprot:Colp12_sorted_trinity150504_noHs@23993
MSQELVEVQRAEKSGASEVGTKAIQPQKPLDFYNFCVFVVSTTVCAAVYFWIGVFIGTVYLIVFTCVCASFVLHMFASLVSTLGASPKRRSSESEVVFSSDDDLAGSPIHTSSRVFEISREISASTDHSVDYNSGYPSPVPTPPPSIASSLSIPAYEMPVGQHYKVPPSPVRRTSRASSRHVSATYDEDDLLEEEDSLYYGADSQTSMSISETTQGSPPFKFQDAKLNEAVHATEQLALAMRSENVAATIKSLHHLAGLLKENDHIASKLGPILNAIAKALEKEGVTASMALSLRLTADAMDNDVFVKKVALGIKLLAQTLENQEVSKAIKKGMGLASKAMENEVINATVTTGLELTQQVLENETVKQQISNGINYAAKIMEDERLNQALLTGVEYVQ